MKPMLLLLLLALAGCSKISDIEPEDSVSLENGIQPETAFADQKLLLEGKFMNSGSYSTSGTAFIYEAKDGKKSLVLSDLKSSAGPDLRIYLAGNKSAANFIELSKKVVNGNSQYDIPAQADISKQRFVLIWCKQFSVLFGHAELK